jgi:flavin reductase (DIM6/NTAB) family NADH-FMN oxidoreductase RutF
MSMTNNEAFKTAMRRMAGAVCIVATGFDGKRAGMAATSVVSLSADPPSLLVCVNKSASVHPLLHACGMFSVSVLSREQQDLCADFGGKYDQEERFNRSRWLSGPFQLPHSAGAQATFFCKIATSSSFATHTVFIAEVFESHFVEQVDPLVYLNGQCRALA